MMVESVDLPSFFAFALGLVISLYVTLDGFDLGIGILFPFAPQTVDRNLMMETLEPLWDGNETWLVFGGMLLLAGFPLAFSVLLPAFYVPIALMLLGLVLRGIAFEFRSQSGSLQPTWSLAFAAGSALAAFCQGAILGAYIEGDITVVDGQFGGQPFDWLKPFSFATGIGVMAGYALLGAGWLIWRTSKATQVFAREIARPALLVTGSAVALVSVWTVVSVPSIAGRWLTWPAPLLLAPLPLLAAAAWLTVWRSLWSDRQWLPFAATICLFLTALAGLGISVWPAAIPGVMTIWEASSARSTQMLVGIAIIVILPLVLGYISFSYWVFRGKVRERQP